jgi:2-keto-4-pentenoate hydratase
MAGDRLERLARLLVEARKGGSLVRSDDAPRDAAEVYRIQDAVLHALSGTRRPNLWKAIPPRAGAEPLATPVPPQGVLASPATAAAARHGLLGVEAEIAFRLGAALEVEEAIAAIELAETRLAEWKGASAWWKLADFQSHGAFVLGSGTRAWRRIDFAAQPVKLLVNGACKASAVGAHPSGDPSRLVPWMLEHCARRGGLQPGDVIATGSWVGIVPVEPGDEILARFPGIGEARVWLV